MLLVALLLAGCGIPQDQYDTVVAERDSIQAELESVNAELENSESKVSELTSNLEDKEVELEATQSELADIKNVYPPTDFSSITELKDWLRANDVSEQPPAANAENMYSKALEIQEDAMKDGYYIWVDIDQIGPNEFAIACVALIGGDLWGWDPEKDEPVQWTGFGKVGR